MFKKNIFEILTENKSYFFNSIKANLLQPMFLIRKDLLYDTARFCFLAE